MRAKLQLSIVFVAASLAICFGDDGDACRTCENILKAKWPQADRRFLWFGSSSKATAKSRRSVDDNAASPGPILANWLELCRCVCHLDQGNDLRHRIQSFLKDYDVARREDTLITSFQRRVLVLRCKAVVPNESQKDRVEPKAQILPALLPAPMRQIHSLSNSDNDPITESRRKQNPVLFRSGLEVTPTQQTDDASEAIAVDQIVPQYTVTPDLAVDNLLPKNRTRLSLKRRKQRKRTQAPSVEKDPQTPEAPQIYAILSGSAPHYESPEFKRDQVGPDQTQRRFLHGNNRSTPPANQGYLQAYYGLPEETPKVAQRPSLIHGRLSSLLSQRMQSLIKGSRSLDHDSESTGTKPHSSVFASGHNTDISVDRGGQASAVISSNSRPHSNYPYTATTTPPSHYRTAFQSQAKDHQPPNHPSGIIIHGKNSAAAAFSDNIADTAEKNYLPSGIVVHGKNSAAAAVSDNGNALADSNPVGVAVQGEHAAAAAVGDSVAVTSSPNKEEQPPPRNWERYPSPDGSKLSNGKGGVTYNFVYDGGVDDGEDGDIDDEEDVSYLDSGEPTKPVDNAMPTVEAGEEPKQVDQLPRENSPDAVSSTDNTVQSPTSLSKEETRNWYSQVLKALSNYNLVIVSLLQNVLGREQ